MSNEVGYGKPPKHSQFKKGDKRINRDGRPATAASLSALAKRIGHEVATKKNGEVLTGPDGKPVTVIETILRQWAQNPRQQGDFVDRAYGKVPQQQQLTGADGGAIETKQTYDLTGLDDSELERLAHIVAKLSGNRE